MNIVRRILPLAALALFSVFSCAGCKSSTQPAASQNAQQTSNAAQPSPAGQQASTTAQQAAAPAPQAPPPPAVVDLPAGTDIRVRLDQDLGSKISQAGDSFTATVEAPVLVNGQTVIPKGTSADGAVIDAKPLGRFKGGAVLAIRLERVHTKWGSYPVATSTIARAEKGKGKRSAILTGGGAGLGALIGGLAGGGKGAAIGALAGGGAGAAGSAFTGNKEILLPAETLLTFRLDRSVHIAERR